MSNTFINNEDDYEKIEYDDFKDKEGDKHTIESPKNKKEKIIQIGKEDKEIVIAMKEENNTIELPEGEYDYLYKGIELIGDDMKEAMKEMKEDIKKGFNSLLLYLSTFDINPKEPEELQEVEEV